MSEVKISVIIPVYNVEQWISDCFDSILSQSFHDFEIICVNDASSDGSQSVVDRYSAIDPRIKVIKNDKNEGLMITRRRGYEAAEGDYLFFYDSDDFLPGDALKRLYDAALSSETEIIAGDLALWRHDGKKAVRSRKNVGQGWDSYLSAILNGTTCSLCGMLFHKSLFQDVEYETFQNCNYSEDRILLTQMLLRKKPSVTAIPHITYYYRINPSSLTRVKFSDEVLCSQLKALFRCYEYVNANNPDSRLSRCNDRFIMRYIGYYVECGYDVKVMMINNRISYMMHGKELVRILGGRLGWHVYLCIKSRIYRISTHLCRKVIRKIQGKD